MESKSTQRCILFIVIAIPLMILLCNGAITVVPGSPAELWHHWVFYLLPFLMLPGFILWQIRFAKSGLFGFLFGFLFVCLAYLMRPNFESYLTVRAAKTSSARLQYVDMGDVFPRFELRSVCYYQYVVSGVQYREKPRDLFRCAGGRAKECIIFVDERRPEFIVVAKETYVKDIQRFWACFGGCLLIASVLGVVIGRGAIDIRNRGCSGVSGQTD